MTAGIPPVGGPGGIDPYAKTARRPAAPQGGEAADRVDVSDAGKTLARVAHARYLQGKTPAQLESIAQAVEIARRAPDIREDRVREARERLRGGLTADANVGPIADRIPGPLVLRSR
jgi:hypothetical protein